MSKPGVENSPHTQPASRELSQTSNRRKFLASGLKVFGGIATLGASTAAVVDGRQRTEQAYQTQMGISRTSTASADIQTKESAANQSILGAAETTVGIVAGATTIFLGLKRPLEALVDLISPTLPYADTPSDTPETQISTGNKPGQTATIFQFPPSGS